MKKNTLNLVLAILVAFVAMAPTTTKAGGAPATYSSLAQQYDQLRDLINQDVSVYKPEQQCSYWIYAYNSLAVYNRMESEVIWTLTERRAKLSMRIGTMKFAGKTTEVLENRLILVENRIAQLWEMSHDVKWYQTLIWHNANVACAPNYYSNNPYDDQGNYPAEDPVEEVTEEEIPIP